MRWIILIVRILLGLLFLTTGLDHFLKFMPPRTAPAGPAGEFAGILHHSGYLTVVKFLELSGGALVLSGRLAPLGLTLLTPVIVNILLFEVFLTQQPGIGVVLILADAFLIFGYWRYFKSVFTTDASIWPR
ncbi:MAG TPA: DoxX family membrane protein [Gemmataceae bacterium]|jgi:uncharacterized membrane protein YphA (DoxX/SURF4 family)|nr:DoxX family membrane protein [Gemmataceae bacterium]